MNERLLADARVYASRYQLEIGETLGSGKDGIVVVAKNKEKAADVALKVFRFDEAYRRERDVYHRLKNRQIQQVAGFNVPQFIASDDNLRAIEMTIVSRPFVLDFAGAYLDKRPEFPAEVWADWEAEKREQFEERWL